MQTQRRRRCPMQCPSVHTLPPLHPSILPSISSLAGHSHFAKQSSFPFITSSSAAPSFLSVRSSSARPPFLNPSTPIGFFRDLSFERLSSSLYPSSSPPRISSRESLLRLTLFFFSFLSFYLCRKQVRVRICSPLPVSFGPTHFLISDYLRGRGFAKERRTTTSEKGAAETSDGTRHLHALLHMRGIARDPTEWKIDR